jgi:diacylglycerol kinase (ATP)
MKSSRTVQIIVNPNAGARRGSDLATRLVAELQRHGFVCSVEMTREKTAPPCWTQNGSALPDFLVCLTGDGTLDKIASGAMQHKVPIIFAPVGFGNIFAREFGYRADVDFIVGLLTEGRQIQVDVGIRTEQPTGRQKVFLSTASYGFLEEVKKFAEGARRPHRRSARALWYLVAAGRLLLSTRPMTPLRVTVDGETVTEKGNIALVSNVPAYTGYLSLTPSANPVDGKLDVCVISADSKWTLVLSLLNIWLTGSTNGKIEHRAGTSIQISGQPVADIPLPKGRYDERFSRAWSDSLTVIPRAMTIIVPRNDTRI